MDQIYFSLFVGQISFFWNMEGLMDKIYFSSNIKHFIDQISFSGNMEVFKDQIISSQRWLLCCYILYFVYDDEDSGINNNH